jgi:CRISPR-associated protein (TIGR03986 family)
MIKSPYNFVPVSNKVFFPDWADQVSHDVPFSDGESGTIKVKLTAKSPIFVRNGSKDKDETSFSNLDGKYFIPGTSIKGMIRSVLEIMSFGKMKQVDTWTPTYRDLSKTETGKKYKSSMKNVKCGWLQYSDKYSSGFEIVDCGEPARISHNDIDKKFPNLAISFHDAFNSKGDINKRMKVNSDEEKAAKYKYQLFSINSLMQKCEVKRVKEKDNYITAVLTNDGNETGTIIFTGQPGVRNDMSNSGKHLEFVFIEPGNPNRIEIKKEVLNNFRKAYYDGEKEESLDWKYWKGKLEKNECNRIPVFFQKEGNEIKHFGLSYLYKLPHNQGIKEGIKNISEKHFSSKSDLAECVFGKIEQKNILNKEEQDIIGSMKGRVQFSHAFAKEGTFREMLEINTVLGSPKPSFYPNYIRNKKGYNDTKIQIKGRKRYPVHKKNAEMQTYAGTSKTEVKFKPIVAKDSENLEFKCSLRFHNLKKIELGALLVALTFYGNNNEMFHSIGLAKGLGYGKIKLAISEINCDKLADSTVGEYMDYFVSEIESNTNIGWKTNDSIIELLTMASEQNNIDQSEATLKHMNLNPKEKINEFVDAKNENEQLSYYSEIRNGITPARVESLESKAKKRKIEEQKESILSSADNNLVNEMLKMTNSQFKSFLREIAEDDLDKMNSLSDAFPILKGGQKKIIENELKKGKGGLFKQLKMMENKIGKSFL